MKYVLLFAATAVISVLAGCSKSATQSSSDPTPDPNFPQQVFREIGDSSQQTITLISPTDLRFSMNQNGQTVQCSGTYAQDKGIYHVLLHGPQGDTNQDFLWHSKGLQDQAGHIFYDSANYDFAVAMAEAQWIGMTVTTYCADNNNHFPVSLHDLQKYVDDANSQGKLPGSFPSDFLDKFDYFGAGANTFSPTFSPRSMLIRSKATFLGNQRVVCSFDGSTNAVSATGQ